MRYDFSKQFGQRIIIHGKSETQYLNLCEITHMCYSDTVVSIYTEKEQVNSSKQLKEFEEELSEFGFLRINRSTIVNQAHIKAYKGGENKSIELVNGSQFTVSRRKGHYFK